MAGCMHTCTHTHTHTHTHRREHVRCPLTSEFLFDSLSDGHCLLVQLLWPITLGLLPCSPHTQRVGGRQEQGEGWVGERG